MVIVIFSLHTSTESHVLGMYDINFELHLGRVSLKHDGTDGPLKSVNTDGTAIERADGAANTGANYQIITY